MSRLATVTDYHMGINVRRALVNWGAKEAQRWRNADGTQMTVFQMRTALIEHLRQGHEIIPMGKCDNWDWEEGCLGHPEIHYVTAQSRNTV